MKSDEITLTINDESVVFVRKDSIQHQQIGPEVIVRTYSAGIHIGTIKERNGTEIILSNARRLWMWKGAFTLNAVATKGVNREESRISTPVQTITLQWIEIIPVSENIDLTSTEK